MAKFNYENLPTNTSSTTKYERGRVGFFNALKDDGDEAIVRFNYSSSKEFELVSVHKVKIGNGYRAVSCLKEHEHDSLSKCPLCANGDTPKIRFFVEMLVYTRDETGNIVAKPMIWERPASFARYLNTCLAEYGDLKNVVFKLRRQGARGDMKTTYTCMFANPSVYKDDIYVKDFHDFENLDLSKFAYQVRSYDDMKEYNHTGEFPMKTINHTETTHTAQETTSEVKYTEQPKEEAYKTTYVSETPDVEGRQKRTYRF